MPIKPRGLVFAVRTTQEMLAEGINSELQAFKHGNDGSRVVIVTVPTYRLATLLCQNYEANIDSMCRILHMPSLRTLTENFYLQLARDEAVAPEQAALLLSVLSLSAFFSPPLEVFERAVTEDTSACISKCLAHSTSDVLDYSRRYGRGTLEDIQAYIVMSFVAFHHDGYSSQGRLHMSAAMALSRNLGLHRTDADPESEESHYTPKIKLDRELRRRVFWYLASAEWYAASQALIRTVFLIRQQAWGVYLRATGRHIW